MQQIQMTAPPAQEQHIFILYNTLYWVLKFVNHNMQILVI